MIEHSWISIEYWSLFIICNYLYQSGYYSYLIKVGLSLSEDAKSSFVAKFALFNLYCLELWKS